MLTGGKNQTWIRERSQRKDCRLESGEATLSFSTEQDKVMLLVDVSEKYEIAEKVLLIYTSSFTSLKKEGQKLKAKRSLSYFMVEVKLLSPYLLVSI